MNQPNNNPEDLERQIREAAEAAYAKMHWLERDSKEWHRAWNGLWRQGVMLESGPVQFTPEDRDREPGEDWQYLGTSLQTALNGVRYWRHDFRHRWHPVAKQRLYVQIPATVGWTPWEGGAQ